MPKIDGFVWIPPPTEHCGQCQGSGQIPGTFSHQPFVCMPCDGFGRIHAKTGEALTYDERIAYLRAQLKRESQRNNRLRADLAELEQYREGLRLKRLAEAAYPRKRGG